MRAFAPSIGIAEDPVTGSLAAAFARWLIGNGQLPARTTVRQGTRLHRCGIIQLDTDGEQLWVSGHTSPAVTGTIDI